MSGVTARGADGSAQKRDHWLNRAKNKPAAPCEAAGCHEHTEIPNAEDSA